MIVKKFLNQKVLGYNEDFTKTYIEHRVQLDTGEVKTVYDASVTDDKGFTSLTELTEIRPYVAHPQVA